MSLKNSPGWQVVPKNDWTLDASVCSSRRTALLDGRGFDRILAEIIDSLEIDDVLYKPMKKGEAEKRAVVTIRTRPEAVDQFHNSSSGYRAQYYTSTELGENSNRRAVEALSAQIFDRLTNGEFPKVPLGLLATSLAQRQSKVWIHQGRWLLFSRREARILRVHRWQLGLESPCAKARKLARWASLAPSTETRIVLKGGFLSPNGEPIPDKGKCESDRSSLLHSLGFT